VVGVDYEGVAEVLSEKLHYRVFGVLTGFVFFDVHRGGGLFFKKSGRDKVLQF